MGSNYLMDTNVINDYTGKKFTGSSEVELDAAFNSLFYYSVISRIETLGFNADAFILQGLEGFLDLGHQYYVTDDIASQTILLRRSLPKVKTPDAIIAATALFYNYTLLSRNLADFKNIPALTVIDPYTL